MWTTLTFGHMSAGAAETAAERAFSGMIEKDNQQTNFQLGRRQKAVPLREATSRVTALRLRRPGRAYKCDWGERPSVQPST
jgi:hypothetical protein